MSQNQESVPQPTETPRIPKRTSDHLNLTLEPSVKRGSAKRVKDVDKTAGRRFTSCFRKSVSSPVEDFEADG